MGDVNSKVTEDDSSGCLSADIIAIRDKNGSLHFTPFHVHLKSSCWSRSQRCRSVKARHEMQRVRVFINGNDATGVLEDFWVGGDGRCHFYSKEDGSTCHFFDKRRTKESRRLFPRPIYPGAGLSGLNLKDGKNEVVFQWGGVRGSHRKSSSSKYQCHVRSSLFIWDYTDDILVTDIDGTLTISDFRGHVNTVRRSPNPKRWADCTQPGACDFFTKASQKGYRVLYLTARPISWQGSTRAYIRGLRQSEKGLPNGPVLCSTHHAAYKIFVSVFSPFTGGEKSERIKASALGNLLSCFTEAGRMTAPRPESSFSSFDDNVKFIRNPLRFAFGNKSADTAAYLVSGISRENVYCFDYIDEANNGKLPVLVRNPAYDNSELEEATIERQNVMKERHNIVAKWNRANASTKSNDAESGSNEWKGDSTDIDANVATNNEKELTTTKSPDRVAEAAKCVDSRKVTENEKSPPLRNFFSSLGGSGKNRSRRRIESEEEQIRQEAADWADIQTAEKAKVNRKEQREQRENNQLKRHSLDEKKNIPFPPSNDLHLNSESKSNRIDFIKSFNGERLWNYILNDLKQ
eukprot:g6114.t1